jgi:hypothetical protein
MNTFSIKVAEGLIYYFGISNLHDAPLERGEINW